MTPLYIKRVPADPHDHNIIRVERQKTIRWEYNGYSPDGRFAATFQNDFIDTIIDSGSWDGIGSKWVTIDKSEWDEAVLLATMETHLNQKETI